MPPEDQKSLWMTAIGRFPRDRLQVALGKCLRKHPAWPPEVGEFVVLCDVDAEELGLPDVTTAFMEAQKKAGMVSGSWSHPAIREAVKRVGSYDIQTATTKSEQASVLKRFEAEYNSLARAMANGQQLLESDRQHNPDKYLERKMIEEGNRQAAEMGFAGISADDALAQMKQRLRNRK